MTKVPSINAIFDRYKNGDFTCKALLYQDIIRYSLVLVQKGKDNSAKLWDLTRWLLDHNTEFVNAKMEPSNRNKSTSNIIEDRMDRIRKSVTALCILQIMDEVGEIDQLKGMGRVKLYGYTFWGFLLALIIESNDTDKETYCENQIYDLWQLELEEGKSPVDKFNSKIFKKYKQNGVFGLFVVDRIRKFVNSKGSVMDTMKDVRECISTVHADYDNVKLFLQLWQETWDELDLDSRKKLLHHFKSIIETEMSQVAYHPKEYEEHRFALRNDLEVLAIEAICRNCGIYNYASVKIVPYLRRRKVIQAGPKIVKCAQCENFSVEIPRL